MKWILSKGRHWEHCLYPTWANGIYEGGKSLHCFSLSFYGVSHAIHGSYFPQPSNADSQSLDANSFPPISQLIWKVAPTRGNSLYLGSIQHLWTSLSFCVKLRWFSAEGIVYVENSPLPTCLLWEQYTNFHSLLTFPPTRKILVLVYLPPGRSWAMIHTLE